MAALPAAAVVVSVTVTGPGATGDLLAITSVPLADEVGFFGTFPVGEQISFSSGTTVVSVCPSVDLTMINQLVTINNVGTVAFPDLYYVAPGGGSPGVFSNYDGFVNGSMAMRIDKVGNNQPLVYESMTQDGVFEPGETWRFIVQDYVAVVPVDSFYSPATVGGSDTLPSLIVPEPTGAVLGLLGGLLALRRRR